MINKQKIKIAQVITRLDWGGSPDILRLICYNLDPNLYEVTLITGLTKYPSLKTKKFIEEFKEKIIVIAQLKRNINLFFDLVAFIKLYLLFRNKKFDIVHTHTAKAGILARLAAYLGHKSIIIHTLHCHNFYGYFNPFFSYIIVLIERFMAFFTDIITVLTELEKKDLLKFKIAKENKIKVIYPGLEFEEVSYIDKEKTKKLFNFKTDEKLVGMVGRLEPVKGAKYFIMAGSELAKENKIVKFLLVGEGSQRKKLESLVKHLGLLERFIFLGWQEEISKIISILDILVLPSLNEAVGLVLLEAQSQGVPIVATRVGGIPEVVKEGQTAILVPPYDISKLVAAIGDLLEDREKYLSFSLQAKKWVKEKFSTQKMIGDFLNLYQECFLGKDR